MSISKFGDHIEINIKMQKPSQEHPASSRAPNKDVKDMDVLCTFRINIESHNLDPLFTKDNDHIQIKIEMQNPSQEAPESSKAPNEDLMDIDVLCTFRINVGSQVLIHRCMKYQ